MDTEQIKTIIKQMIIDNEITIVKLVNGVNENIGSDNSEEFKIVVNEAGS